MYTQFNDYVDSFCNGFDDYWFDEGYDIAREMLNDFTIDDWNKLIQISYDKSYEWNIKVAYAIDDNCGLGGIDFLLNGIEKINNELITSCIDSLRSYNVDILNFDNEKKKKLKIKFYS